MHNNKLILHFDARNTLFVSDFNLCNPTEKALNTYISGLVWGIVVDGVWQVKHKEISTGCPDNCLISFYKYMESSIVKCPEDRQILRERLGTFTQDHETQFESIYLKHLKKLEWIYDYNEFLTVRGCTGKLYHYILPTFFHTIENLYESKRDFAIIIRTFGLNIPHILDAIKTFLNGDHPMFPRKLDIDLFNDQCTLKMDSNNNEYIYYFKTSTQDEIKQTTNEIEILEHWNSVKGITAVKDDFLYWSKNNYHYSASKPLWINYQSKESDKICHHIFFDDCIRPRDSCSIVHLRKLDTNNNHYDSSGSLPKHSVILNPSETERYININLVQSELLECIRNRNYFIEKIDLCEKRFAEIFY